MNIDQLRAYHPDHPAKSTIYEWVGQNRIPVHKDGKKWRFLKSEIDEWLCGGRNKTQEEIEKEAASNSDPMGKLLRKLPFIQAELLKREIISLDDLSNDEIERLIEWEQRNGSQG